MNRSICILLIACFAVALGGAGGELAPASPTTRAASAAPSTQPAGFSLRGRLSVSAGWDPAKPDLSRAVVYLASDPQLDQSPPPERPAIVSQKDKAFVPTFLAVSRNTVIEFPNFDHYDHNVFSRSKAAPAFDLDRYPYGQSKSRTFEKTGVVQVFCNVHPQMRAIIFVTPNPYFARADKEGR